MGWDGGWGWRMTETQKALPSHQFIVAKDENLLGSWYNLILLK